MLSGLEPVKQSSVQNMSRNIAYPRPRGNCLKAPLVALERLKEMDEPCVHFAMKMSA